MDKVKEYLPKEIDGQPYSYLKEKDYFVAFLVNMPQVSVVADTIKEAVNELAIVWGLVKESHNINCNKLKD